MLRREREHLKVTHVDNGVQDYLVPVTLRMTR